MEFYARIVGPIKKGQQKHTVSPYWHWGISWPQGKRPFKYPLD